MTWIDLILYASSWCIVDARQYFNRPLIAKSNLLIYVNVAILINLTLLWFKNRTSAGGCKRKPPIFSAGYLRVSSGLSRKS